MSFLFSGMKNQNKNIVEKIDKCMDCNNIGKCIEVTACTDAHLYGLECCFKNICKDGCTFTCTACKKDNKLFLNDINIYDNYYESYICWNCDNKNVVNCEFYGDVREMCDRYCNGDCFPNEITINGYQ